MPLPDVDGFSSPIGLFTFRPNSQRIIARDILPGEHGSMQRILKFLEDPEVVFPAPEVLANAAPGVLDADAAPVPLGVLDVVRDPSRGCNGFIRRKKKLYNSRRA